MNLGLILVSALLSMHNMCFAAEGSLKIGIINTKNLENCLYAKHLQKNLEKEFTPRTDKFEVKKQELQSKQELFQRDKAVLSEKERMAKDRELTKLQQEVQHMFESLGSEFKSRQQEESVVFNKIIDDAVAHLAKQEKYDLILIDQVVLYNADFLDCTNKIITAVDAKFKSKK